jgi:hypothetical protein
MDALKSKIERVAQLEDARMKTRIELEQTDVVSFDFLSRVRDIADCLKYMYRIGVSPSSPIDATLFKYNPQIQYDEIVIRSPKYGLPGFIFEINGAIYLLCGRLFVLRIPDSVIRNVFGYFSDSPCGFFGKIFDDVFYLNGLSTYYSAGDFVSVLGYIIPETRRQCSTGGTLGGIGFRIFVPRTFTVPESTVGNKNDELTIRCEKQAFEWKRFFSPSKTPLLPPVKI